MSKKVIEIAQTEYLSLFLDTLIVNKDGARITIPLRTIDTILITNPFCSITVPLLNKIVNYNINLIICNNKYQPTIQINPINSYYSNKNYLAQIRWDETFKNQIWKQIVRLKIINYSKLIYHLNIATDDEINKLVDYYSSVKLGDETNCEGHAAKLSFKLLYGNSFSRSDDENIVNNFLNFGYIVLMSYVSRSLIKNGLDNRLGIFHKSFNNYFALACDVMEIFRPVIDYFTYSFLIKEQNDSFSEYKKTLFSSFENLIFKNHKSLNDLIDQFIKSIISGNIIEEDYIIDWD
ncbi:type II CRISPR-associated endonuclease Cas1 [Mycoplasma sp. 2634B]|uniref:type II CRISPR-associated endonuclease Cas1 n=1 Tax=unclassified Mycoplasma TaxID=2683645 RepID=UPI003AB02452